MEKEMFAAQLREMIARLRTRKDQLQRDFDESEISMIAEQAFCDITAYMEDWSDTEVRERTATILATLDGQGIIINAEDRAKVIRFNFHPMKNAVAVRSFAEALDTAPQTILEIVDGVLYEDCTSDDWKLDQRIYEKLNALLASADLLPLHKNDPRIITAVLHGMEYSETESRYLTSMLALLDWGLLPFVQHIAPTVEVITSSCAASVPVTATVYLKSVLARLLNKEQIITELVEHGLSESPWVGWEALCKAADDDFEFRDGGNFDSDEGEQAAGFVRMVQIFRPDDKSTVKTIARRMFSDDSLRDANIATFERYRLNLPLLAD